MTSQKMNSSQWAVELVSWRRLGWCRFAVLLFVASCGDPDGAGPAPVDDGSAPGDVSVEEDLSNLADVADTGPIAQDAEVTDAAGDTSPGDAEAGDTAVLPDAPSPDGESLDVVADVPDGATEDVSDVVDGGRAQGTVPLSDFIACTTNTDCRSGTGDCITEVPFNRRFDGSPEFISIRELAPDWPAAGVCSRTCSDQANACAELRLPRSTVDYTCQVVAVSTAPYVPVEGGLPDPSGLDPNEQTLGQPFAALCVPPFRVTSEWPPDFCEPCSSELACEAGSACWLDTPFSESSPSTLGTCLAPCDEACPIGFACQALDAGRGGALEEMGEGTWCVPLADTCGTCRDADGDGFGTGLCNGNDATPHDCDDTIPWAWFDASDMEHSFPDVCGEFLDANCNGIGDVYEQMGTAVYGQTHCTACLDACGGAVDNGTRVCTGGALAPTCGVQCTDPLAWVDCDLDPVTGCETAASDPGRLFYPDCDGDSVPRNVTPTFDCTGEGSVAITVGDVSCVGLLAVVVDGEAVFDCDDEDAFNVPGGLEVCDGFDNDCNVVVDDTPLLLSGDLRCRAPGVLGVCATNGTWACDISTASGEVCVPALAVAERCDLLDNDCDGVVDEQTVDGAVAAGATCDVTGVTFATTIDASTNLCRTGTWTCAEGDYACTPYRSPEASVCTNTCASARNGVCDDGGFLSTTGGCALGSDCADCGERSWTDWPGDDEDADCDGFDGDLDHALFVRQLGSDTTGTGAPGAAYRTLDVAWAQVIARANGANRVYQLVIADDVTSEFVKGPITIAPRTGFGTTHREGAMFGIFGGYRYGGSTSWTPGGRSRLTFPSGLCAWDFSCRRDITHYDYLPMVNVKNPMDVRLDSVSVSVEAQAWQLRLQPEFFDDHLVGLSCECAPETVLGVTSATCNWCENLSLNRFSVAMASGAGGADGVAGVQGVNGLDAVQPPYAGRSVYGTLPVPAQLVCGSQVLGCSGGACTVALRSTRGGTGGTVYDPPNNGTYNCNIATAGYLGGDGAASPDTSNRFGAGAGGRGAYEGVWSAAAGVAGEHAYTPTPRGAGGTGPGPFAVSSGTNGWLGLPGGGGGGGGGGFSFDCTVGVTVEWDGNHGTGGASGGCGGGGGTGGQAGRTAVGLLVQGTAFVTVLDDVSVAVDGAGSGGNGGAAGPAGLGGASLPGINPENGARTTLYPTAANTPGAGGAGGDGAGGGGGGGGAGGWCVAVYAPQRAEMPLSLDLSGSCSSPARGGNGGAQAPRFGLGNAGAAGFPGAIGQSWLVYPE